MYISNYMYTHYNVTTLLQCSKSTVSHDILWGAQPKHKTILIPFLLHVWQPVVGEWCQVDYLCFLTGQMKCHLCLVSVSCGSLVDSCDDMVSFEMVSDTSRGYNFTIGRVVVLFSVRIIAARVFPSLPKTTFSTTASFHFPRGCSSWTVTISPQFLHPWEPLALCFSLKCSEVLTFPVRPKVV